MNEIAVVNRPAALTVSGFTAELFGRWTSYIDAAPKTVETYNKAVRQFIIYLKENGITQPTREDIITYKERIASTHKPTTAQSYLMAVKQFFKWTQQEGLYPNVADKVKAVKLDKGHKKDYLTSGQVKGLLTEASGASLAAKRDFAILALMITSGLRTIEVARANIEDMRTVADFTALYIQGKGHTEKTDYVKLTQPVENAIRDYLKARGKTSATAPLFSSISNRDKGQRMTTRSISRIVKDHLIGAGLDSDRLTAHSLRHTAATLNLLNGGSIEETQQLLRHTSINTTLIYSHALERAKNNSEQRISAAIFG